MKEIQGKSTLVRVSVRFKLGGFELSGVNCIKLNSFHTTKKVPPQGFIKVKFEYFEYSIFIFTEKKIIFLGKNTTKMLEKMLA